MPGGGGGGIFLPHPGAALPGPGPGPVRIADGRARVEMERPIRAVAPGQSAVFYAPDGRVLGGGVIQKEEG